MSTYMKSFIYKRQSREEEHDDIISYQNTNNEKALERLIKGNIVFIFNLCRHYYDNKFTYDELLSEAIQGFIKGIYKFDTNKNVRLFTYCHYWIKVYLSEYITKNLTVVPVGESTRFKSIKKLIDTDKDYRDIAKEVKGYKSTVLRVMNYSDFSLNTKLCEDFEEYQTHQDLLLSNYDSPEEMVIDKNIQDKWNHMRKCVQKRISKRDNIILNRRILKDEPDSLESIGKDLKISRERVRQIEKRIKKNLVIEI